MAKIAEDIAGYPYGTGEVATSNISTGAAEII